MNHLKLNKVYKKRINKRIEKNIFRNLPDSRKNFKLDFSSNDYLQMSQHTKVLDAAKKALSIYGVGATGSRLLSGNTEQAVSFERLIAKSKNFEKSLIFSSGFQCNYSVLSTLIDTRALETQPFVYFDRLNHSSLYQAALSSKAKLIRYRHNDWEHLQKLIESQKNNESPKFIVTETLFGMDGDVAPLNQIIKIAKEHNALLYLDDSHSTGILGKHGYGISSDYDLSDLNTIVMGTFSKAIGCSGAYVACNQTINDYIINFCPGFIYSTAPSPVVISAAHQAWKLLPSMNQERKKLNNLGSILRRNLIHHNFEVGLSTTNIVPIIIGDNNKTKFLTAELLKKGIKVSCILAPTVPINTARLRIAINSLHTEDDINQLVYNLICINLK